MHVYIYIYILSYVHIYISFFNHELNLSLFIQMSMNVKVISFHVLTMLNVMTQKVVLSVAVSQDTQEMDM